MLKRRFALAGWEQVVDGFAQRVGAEAGEFDSPLGAWFAMFRVAREEDGAKAEVGAEVDVGERVAEDEAGGRFDAGEVGLGLVEHAGERLAAVALVFVVGADVEGIDVRAGFGEGLLQVGVDCSYRSGGVFAEGDAALVGDDEDAEAGAVEAGDGVGDAGEQGESIPTGDVFALGELAVDDSVTVEEYGLEWASGGSASRGVEAGAVVTMGHTAIIASERPGSWLLGS